MDTLGKAGTKAKANNIRAALQAVSTWARARNHITEAWVEGVEQYELKGGHKPWTEVQCAAAEAMLTGWLRRAYYLGRYTGQGGSDVVRIGFGDIEDGMIHVVQKKTGVECRCPIEAFLAAEMASWERRPGPFVYSPDGSSLTKSGLDQAFNRARVGIPELAGTTWHGLSQSGCRAAPQGNDDAADTGLGRHVSQRGRAVLPLCRQEDERDGDHR
jgi:hypothetical protein